MSRFARFLTVAGTAATLAACHRGADPAPAAVAASAAPAYAAQARGRIDVQGGLVQVAAPRDGRIERIASVGDTVAVGQALVVLDARQGALAVKQAEAEWRQLQAQARAQRARLPAARQHAERLRAAAQAGAASGQAADDAQAQFTALTADLGVTDANVASGRVRLEQARFALGSGSVRAAIGGKVIESYAQAGQYVAAYTPLLRLLPDKPLIVRADVNEAFIARLRPGMKAEVVSLADEHLSASAELARIGEIFRAEQAVDGQDAGLDARAVSCELRLEAGAAGPWRPGQRVLVRFLP